MSDELKVEYEKIIDLFINENRTSWELVSIYLVVQIGLLSVGVVLYTNAYHNISNLKYLFLFITGAVSSFVWFLMQSRARMKRENWYYAGLRIEKRLGDSDILHDSRFCVFEIERQARDGKLALELFENEVRFRKQRLQERIGALGLAHWAMPIWGLIWTGLIILSLIQRFCPIGPY